MIYLICYSRNGETYFTYDPDTEELAVTTYLDSLPGTGPSTRPATWLGAQVAYEKHNFIDPPEDGYKFATWAEVDNAMDDVAALWMETRV